ncbi:MAG: rhamnulokinase [Bacilli bacterium]|nr:rhamnulokinase [Bacilli bacterium]
MPLNNYVAIDLGATSGRVIVSSDARRLDEVYRFKEYLKNDNGVFTWDLDKIWNNILIGLKKAVEKYHTIASIGIDSWGVDYVLMNQDTPILPAYSYRDSRTKITMEEVHKIVSFNELYSVTGIQKSLVNTVYQFMDDHKKGRLAQATDFLFIPEYFSYLLTGKKVHEYSMATTTGLIDMKTGQYSEMLINKLGFPKQLFQPVIKPGNIIGSLKPEIAQQIGSNATVVLPVTHDTASAFYAVDVDPDSVIISSGTWSLVGVKLKQGNNSTLSLNTNFANEGSKDFICYLKNIMGLWLLNEVKKKHTYSYDEITNLALTSTYNEVFDVDDTSLLSPNDMKEAICKLLPANNQPKTDGDLYRSIFRSLATTYKKVCEQLSENLHQRYNRICIVGGGANNKALNQFTQEITQHEVIAIPMEATTVGNLKIQKEVIR